jgi:hypothetical protein
MTFARTATYALLCLGLADVARAEPTGSLPASQPEPDDPAELVVPVPPEPTPAPVEATPPAPRMDPTAAETSGAPLPGSESGRLDEVDDGASPFRWIGRGLLFMPRVALEVAFAPVRGGIWAVERYNVLARTYALFFNDAGTIGLYPVVKFQSGFGATVGAKFRYADIFGENERFTASAGTGGRYQDTFATSFRTGTRFGKHVQLGLDAERDRRPREVFYGIGNGDDAATGAAIDPRMDATAVETRYRQQLARVAGVLDVNPVGDFYLKGSGSLTDVDLGRSADGPPIDTVYMPDGLVGFAAGGHRYGYSELEMRYDSRRAGSEWEAQAVPTTGWLVAAFAGRATSLENQADFWRYGGELQKFWRLAQGPRVIVTRLYAEGVTGSRSDVPLNELPLLGGKARLRGYPADRFRDRVATLGSLEYQWDLSHWLSASTFMDAGRVHAAPDEIAFDNLRVGFGVGLSVHTNKSFLFRASVASSIDGGVFLDLAFEPVFETDGRTERR